MADRNVADLWLIVTPGELRLVLRDLDKATLSMCENLRNAIGLDADLVDAKRALRDAAESLAEAENSASMAAYASGKIDGKNAEIRDMQMTAYLNADEQVCAARAAAQTAEDEVVMLSHRAQTERDWYKHGGYQLSALRTKAELLKELITARLAAFGNDPVSDESVF